MQIKNLLDWNIGQLMAVEMVVILSWDFCRIFQKDSALVTVSD
jgi:hypothetical protein